MANRVRRGTGAERPSRPGWTARSLIVVVNGVVVSGGAVYLATGSIAVTAVCGGFGVVLAGWLAAIGR